MTTAAALPFRGVIFDLDGTLIDSIEDIAASVNAALVEFGFPTHTTAAYVAMMGEGASMLVSRALPAGNEARVVEVLERYRTHYARRLTQATRPYPGIPELLRALQSRGVRLGVLSNKRDDFTRAIVAALFPSVPWVAVFGERAGVPKKPDPTAALEVASLMKLLPGEIAFVGDTRYDVHTALAAGMQPVAVSWGLCGADDLRALGARRVITTPLALLES